jgi:hypothetical protein
MVPFFSFYGSKWSLAERLGPPHFEHVIESFAGSAGYSCYWNPKRVTLIDADPVICGIWRYLIGTSSKEVMRLPANIDAVEELPARVCEEARWLIGMWMNRGLTKPAVRRSNWARTPRLAASYWSESIKLRIASQIDGIRHWLIREASYDQAPDIRGHWFIDPPYSGKPGRAYRHNDIDYKKLAKWIKSQRGFVQVCEHDGADWLDFKPLSIVCTPRGSSAESIWEAEN